MGKLLSRLRPSPPSSFTGQSSAVCWKEILRPLPFMPDVNPAAIETAAALLQAYAAGKRDFSNLSLIAANLSSADLKGADLSYADFSEADLSQANLRGADLSYARLREANLTGADLRGAMLIGTDLRDAILADARLKDADYDPEATRFPAGFDLAAADMRADR